MASTVRNAFNLYVKNIPWTVGHNELKQYFSKFGYVQNATVVFNKNSGISRNYGFVIYNNRKGFDSALKEEKHKLEGLTLKVEPSTRIAPNNN